MLWHCLDRVLLDLILPIPPLSATLLEAIEVLRNTWF